MTNEIWKPIPFLNNKWSISDQGRVKFNKTGKIRKQTIGSTGYHVITFKISKGYCKTYMIHRVVMMCFEPISTPELYEVNHKNYIRTDNRLENLEWCTGQENLIHYMQKRNPGWTIADKGSQELKKLMRKQYRKPLRSLAIYRQLRDRLGDKELEKLLLTLL